MRNRLKGYNKPNLEIYLINEAYGIKPDLQSLQAVAHHSFSIFLRLLFGDSFTCIYH